MTLFEFRMLIEQNIPWWSPFVLALSIAVIGLLIIAWFS